MTFFKKVSKIIISKVLNLFNGNFAKNVLLLAGGTAVIQLVNLMLTPIITRIYSPEEYGVLVFYTSFIGLLTVLSSLKYENAIIIAEDDQKAINVVFLCFMILVTFVGIITICLLFFGETILTLFNGEELIQFKYLIPIGVFLIGFYNIVIQLAFREKNFKSIVKTRISQSVTQNSIPIIFGLFKIGSIGLVLGQIFGQSVGVSTLSKPVFKKLKAGIIKINKENMVWIAKRYIKFPVYTAPSQFLNIGGIQLPIFFISSIFGSQIIGFYGLASTIVSLPTRLIGKSVQDVFYSEAASIGKTNPHRLKKLSRKLFKKLFTIGLFPLTILIIFGPYLFSVVFGAEWYEAGVYARIISLLVFARFIFMPISVVFDLFERQKTALLLDITRIILVLAVFGLTKLYSLSSYWAVGLYTFVMSLIYFVTFITAQKIIQDEIMNNENTS